MYRVFKRVRDLGNNVRKGGYVCQQQNLNSKHVNEKSECKSILKSQEIQFLSPSQNQGYDEFKKKYNFKYPNRCSNLLQAITWSTALIFGFYASQLVCLYKRNHRFDHQKCFYAKYLYQKNQQLHKRFIFAQYEQKEQNFVKKLEWDKHKPERVPEKGQEINKYNDKVEIFQISGFEKFFENRFQKYYEDDLLKFRPHDVNNEKDNTEKYEKQEKSNIPAAKNDEALEKAFSCMTKIIGEIELELGIACIRLGNFEGAVEHFKMSTNSNNNSGCFNLALLYEHGLGVEQDLLMAKKLYELAANWGHREALYNLGVFFAQGIGTRKDYRQAKICFEKAAKLGDASSANALNMLRSANHKKLSEPEDFIDVDNNSLEMINN